MTSNNTGHFNKIFNEKPQVIRNTPTLQRYGDLKCPGVYTPINVFNGSSRTNKTLENQITQIEKDSHKEIHFISGQIMNYTFSKNIENNKNGELKSQH